MKTVVGLFDRFADAANAVREIEAFGIERNRISLVASQEQAGGWRAERENGSNNNYGKDGKAITGAVVGGVTGLVAGLIAFMIPGVGSLLGIGPLATALTGAGVGAAAGGLLGTLVDAGVSAADAEAYTEGVRRGGTLLAVAAGEAEVDQITRVMDRYNPVNLERRSAEWRLGGWSPAAALAANTAAANGHTFVAGAATPIINGAATARPGDEAGRIDRIDEKRERPRPESTPAFATAPRHDPDLAVSLPPHLGEFGTTVDAPVESNFAYTQPTTSNYRTGAGIPNPGQEGERGPHHLSSSSPETAMVGKLDDRLAFVDPADVQALSELEPSRGAAVAVVATAGIAAPPSEDRIEPVQETSRKMEMEPTRDRGEAFDRFEDEFRRDFESRRRHHANGNHPGADYGFEEVKAAYHHGCELACDCAAEAKEWRDVEHEARRRWEERGSHSWDQIKEAARFAYDRARANK